LAAAAVVGGGG